VPPKHDAVRIRAEPLLPGFNAVEFAANRTEQVASDTRKLSGADLVLAGHVHLFTTLSFGASRSSPGRKFNLRTSEVKKRFQGESPA
jgi:hypothetical protein